MDLAHELSELREHVEWPPTPDLQPVLEPRGVRSRRRRVVALGLAFAALVAVAAAFAVPSSRGAILRFFHLGAATIVRVDRLPSAEERPLSTGIGPVVTLAEARKRFPGTLLLPPLDPIPPAHLSGPAVSFLFSYRGEPVLLTEFAHRPGLHEEVRRQRHQRRRGGVRRLARRSSSRATSTTSSSPARLRGSQATSCSGSARGPRIASNPAPSPRTRPSRSLDRSPEVRV